LSGRMEGWPVFQEQKRGARDYENGLKEAPRGASGTKIGAAGKVIEI
jgi:hypothetical protein